MGTMSFSAQPIPSFVAFIKEHYKGGTVLDLGCGTGRYTDCFPADMYTGIDGHPGNISFCGATWPDRKWILADLEEWKPKEKYDYLISSVTMEQLDNLPMGWAKHYIMIEPRGHKHNYQEIYKPVVDEPMGESYEGLRMMLT